LFAEKFPFIINDILPNSVVSQLPPTSVGSYCLIGDDSKASFLGGVEITKEFDMNMGNDDPNSNITRIAAKAAFFAFIKIHHIAVNQHSSNEYLHHVGWMLVHGVDYYSGLMD
jgi:hypothetical protein